MEKEKQIKQLSYSSCCIKELGQILLTVLFPLCGKLQKLKLWWEHLGKIKLPFLPFFISAVSILIQLSLHTHKYIMYTFTHIYIPICKYKLRISLVSIWLTGPKAASHDFSSFFGWQHWDQWLKTHMLCAYVTKLINNFETIIFLDNKYL